jgi:hypothetical protein
MNGKVRRKYTVAQAKNSMRRAVAEILDPSPASVDAVWEHFRHRCAYCGCELDREARQGHIDHAEKDGGNHLGNLVLACGTCNGDEKRDQSWREFLPNKASGSVLAEREARIIEWAALHPQPAQISRPELGQLLKEIEDIIASFEQKSSELKGMVGSQT